MKTTDSQVYTVGHSAHAMAEFLDLLTMHDVDALADVRSTPFSRFNPQYNQDHLARALNAVGIRYIFLGRELGARSSDPSCYEDGRVQYDRLASTELFRQGIGQVRREAHGHRLALMCAEKDPLECHRMLLVSRTLDNEGVAVVHILGDGQLETQQSAVDRLLGLHGLGHPELFRSYEERVSEAFARQEQKVAYVNQHSVAKMAGE